MAPRPDVTAFFDEATNTVSYVVVDPATRAAAVVDPVLDYDAASGRTGRNSADKIIAHLRAHGLTCQWLLETHVHADHLSAAPYIRRKARRQARHRRAHQRGAGDLRQGVQPRHRVPPRRQPVRPPVRGREEFPLGSRSDAMHMPVTRRPASPMSSAMRCSSATRCSCPTTAPRAPISRRHATHAVPLDPQDLRCPARRGCSCATTTRRRRAQHSLGDHRRPRSARGTSTCTRA